MTDPAPLKDVFAVFDTGLRTRINMSDGQEGRTKKRSAENLGAHCTRRRFDSFVPASVCQTCSNFRSGLNVTHHATS
jgi:hypothetical protein